MDALAAAHDATVQMIDTSIVRVHQHAACIVRIERQSMFRSRGGLTSKIHAVVDSSGLPVRLALTAGEAHDNRIAAKLLSRLTSGSMLLADRAYDADWIRALVRLHGDWADIPLKRNRTQALCFSRIFIELEIKSSASSIRSSTVGVSQPATTSSPPTTSHSSNLRQSGSAAH